MIIDLADLRMRDLTGAIAAGRFLARIAARPPTCRRHWTWPARWASRWTCPPNWTRCAGRPVRPCRPL